MTTTPPPVQTFAAVEAYPNTCVRCGYRLEQHSGPERNCRDSGMRRKGAPAPEPEQGWLAAPRDVFPALGIQVRGDVIEAHATVPVKVLGPLAGAEARLTDGTDAWDPGKGLLLGLGVAALATKKMAVAFIIFADGRHAEKRLNGNRMVREAQAEAVRFNLLAGRHALPAEPGSSAQREDPVQALRMLASLHDEGLLTDAEYEAKRAEVIARI